MSAVTEMWASQEHAQPLYDALREEFDLPEYLPPEPPAHTPRLAQTVKLITTVRVPAEKPVRITREWSECGAYVDVTFPPTSLIPVRVLKRLRAVTPAPEVHLGYANGSWGTLV